jgi:hypothetical protein
LKPRASAVPADGDAAKPKSSASLNLRHAPLGSSPSSIGPIAIRIKRKTS